MHNWFECKIKYEKTMENGLTKQERSILRLYNRGTHIAEDESAELYLLEDNGCTYSNSACGDLVGLLADYVARVEVTILVHKVSFHLRDRNIASTRVEDEIKWQLVNGAIYLGNTASLGERNLHNPFGGAVFCRIFAFESADTLLGFSFVHR